MKEPNNIDETVSVIIPTFNRAKFLAKTIPTYNQEYVKEIIIINDNSTDDTLEVLEAIKNDIPIIKIINSTKKLKQTGAKNLGIRASNANYLFFGDDDSVLSAGAIKNLLNQYRDKGPCISSLLHTYMDKFETEKSVIKNFQKPAEIKSVYNPNLMKLNFSHKWEGDINLPFCCAHFLISSKDVAHIRFNERYKGTCYREETDFIINIKKNKKLDIVINFDSWVINLPRDGDSGGTQSYGFLSRKFSEVYNEYLFFKDHGKYLSEYVIFSTNPIVRSLMHVINAFLPK